MLRGSKVIKALPQQLALEATAIAYIVMASICLHYMLSLQWIVGCIVSALDSPFTVWMVDDKHLRSVNNATVDKYPSVVPSQPSPAQVQPFQLLGIF